MTRHEPRPEPERAAGGTGSVGHAPRWTREQIRDARLARVPQAQQSMHQFVLTRCERFTGQNQ